MVPVLTLLLAIVGPLACAGLVTAGRRAAAAGRIRALGPRARWRLPRQWRDPLARALLEADHRDRAGGGGGVLGYRRGRRHGVGRRVRARDGDRGGGRRARGGPGRAPDGLLAPANVGSRPDSRARWNTSRRSCAAAGPSRARWNGSPGPTAPSRSTSGGSTSGPSSVCRSRMRSPAGPPSTTCPGCGPRPAPCRWRRRWAVRRPRRSTGSRHRCVTGSRRRPKPRRSRPRRGLSAGVVGVAPLGYLAFSALVDPHSVTVLVATGVGRVCLVVGLGLEALAALWIRRIVRSTS